MQDVKPAGTLKESGAPPILTRNDQLSFKSTRKQARKDKANDKKNGKGKTGKRGKGKVGKGKKKDQKKEKKNTGKGKGMSRKRQILKNSPTKQPPQQEPSGSSVDKPKGKGTKAGSSASPLPKRKREQKEGPKAKAKATPKPKAKATPKPKVEENPKPKATTKPKAAPKPKAKRVKKEKGQDEEESPKRTFNDMLVHDLLEFAHRFSSDDSVRDAAFKNNIRTMLALDTLKTCRLNIYWTRCSSGVTLLDAKLDVQHFSFNSSSAPEAYKAAVSIKLAEQTAPQLNCIYFILFIIFSFAKQASTYGHIYVLNCRWLFSQTSNLNIKTQNPSVKT